MGGTSEYTGHKSVIEQVIIYGSVCQETVACVITNDVQGNEAAQLKEMLNSQINLQHYKTQAEATTNSLDLFVSPQGSHWYSMDLSKAFCNDSQMQYSKASMPMNLICCFSKAKNMGIKQREHDTLIEGD